MLGLLVRAIECEKQRQAAALQRRVPVRLQLLWVAEELLQARRSSSCFSAPRTPIGLRLQRPAQLLAELSLAER
jgi:hypothetical protein